MLGDTAIVLAICADSGHNNLMAYHQPEIIMIGEAAFAHEAEIILLIIQHIGTVQKVTLFGDHEQFPPFVRSHPRTVDNENDGTRWTVNTFSRQICTSLF